MIRRSPTTYEGGYTFYRNIAKWLVSKLGDKTSVYRCMLLSPGSCDMPTHNMAGATTSTGRKVREKIIQLALPY